MQLMTFRNFNEFEDWNCVLMFFHISKCGGTSVNSYLETIFDDRFFVGQVHHTAGLQKFLKTEPKLSAFKGRSFALSGHYQFGAHEVLSKMFPRSYAKGFYITFLRHPVEIAKSFYRYHAGRTMSYCDQNSFLEHYRPYANYMVQFLGAGNLERAKERLEKDYFFFGTVDLLFSSLTLLNRFFKKDIQVEKYWMNKSREKNELTFAQGICDQLLEINQKDNELYLWADRILRHRLEDSGISLEVSGQCGNAAWAPAKPFENTHRKALLAPMGPDEPSLAGRISTLRKKINLKTAKLDDYTLMIALLKECGETATKEYGEICTKLQALTPGFFFFDLIAYYRKVDPAKAITALKEAIALYRKFPSSFSESFLSVFLRSSLLILADIYLTRDDPEASEEYLRESWECSTQCQIAYDQTVPAWRVLVSLYQKQGKTADAERCELYCDQAMPV